MTNDLLYVCRECGETHHTYAEHAQHVDIHKALSTNKVNLQYADEIKEIDACSCGKRYMRMQNRIDCEKTHAYAQGYKDAEAFNGHAVSNNHPNRSMSKLDPTNRLIRQAWKSAQVFVNENSSPSQLLTAQRQLVNEVRRYTKYINEGK